jgi:hypothetical protein
MYYSEFRKYLKTQKEHIEKNSSAEDFFFGVWIQIFLSF